MLLSTLQQAIAAAQNRGQLYADPSCSSANRPGNQECYDSIEFRPTGAVKVPLMAWVNRPTFQQTVEIPTHRPRPGDSTAGGGGGGGAGGGRTGARCTSQRRITFKLAKYHPRSVKIYIGKKLLRTLRGKKARRPAISLKGLSAARVSVKLVIRTGAGKRKVLHRKYRTCLQAKKKKKHAKKRHAKKKHGAANKKRVQKKKH